MVDILDIFIIVGVLAFAYVVGLIVGKNGKTET